jgi:excisionase family DNA binding protein
VGAHRGVRRVPLREAAQLLGVSKDAVRQRIRRGTIRSEKGEDGRVYVFLDSSLDDVHEHDRGQRDHPHVDLVDELRDRVRFLERELERKDAILLNMTEAMKAIAPPAQEEAPPPPTDAPVDEREYTVTPTPQPGRVGPQTPLEGPQESSELPETPLERPEGEEAWVDATGSQEGAEPRVPWWRRMFSG